MLDLPRAFVAWVLSWVATCLLSLIRVLLPKGWTLTINHHMDPPKIKPPQGWGNHPHEL